jgi:hypothetical protein
MIIGPSNRRGLGLVIADSTTCHRGRKSMIKPVLRIAALLAVFMALAASPGFAQGKSKPITLTARVVDAVCLLPGGLRILRKIT